MSDIGYESKIVNKFWHVNPVACRKQSRCLKYMPSVENVAVGTDPRRHVLEALRAVDDPDYVEVASEVSLYPSWKMHQERLHKSHLTWC